MKIKADFHTIFQSLRLIYNCHPKAFVLKVVYVTLQSLLPLANLWVLKLLVDGATTQGIGFSSIVPLVVLFCGITLLGRIVSVLSGVNNDILTQRLVDHINNLIQSQSVVLDMAYYDNPDYHDTFHRAQQEAAFRPVRVLDDFVSIFGAIISLVGTLLLLLQSSWMVVAVMVVAVIPSFFVRLYKSRSIYGFRKDTTQQARRAMYYGQLLSNKNFAKEVRVYGLAGYFRSLYVEVRKGLVEKLFHISKRLGFYDALSAVVEVAALFIVVMFLFRSTHSGAISIGSFVMLFEAFRKGQGYLQSLVNGISGLYENKLFMRNLFDFLDLRPRITSPQNPVAFPSVVDSVEFSDVRFSYPGMNVNVVEDFSLVAKRGEVTRLRGENGFGKTTLLKLLLRLYDVDGGAIKINGADVREMDVQDLRHHIGAIFQDYVQFYFTARQNILFGDIDSPQDEERMQKAIRLADAESVVKRLSKGLDTQLGRAFDNGEELSMGQWQRLALARVLYSEAPILVLDEPTAWMDAGARERFFAHLEEIKKERIVILIMHES